MDPLNTLPFVSETVCGLGNAFKVQGVYKSALHLTRDQQLTGPSLVSLTRYSCYIPSDFWTTSRKYYLRGALFGFFPQISLFSFWLVCHFVTCPNSSM